MLLKSIHNLNLVFTLARELRVEKLQSEGHDNIRQLFLSALPLILSSPDITEQTSRCLGVVAAFCARATPESLVTSSPLGGI